MTKTAKSDPTFKTFGITPRRLKIPVDGTTTTVKVDGTVESTSDNQMVNITLTHPNGKETSETPARYAETERKNILKFEWKYGVDKTKKSGKYNVKCVLRENKNQVRTGTFEVIS